jgi:predicted nuclease with RNAse H fold
MNRIFLGFDPGGAMSFGWCALSISGSDQSPEIKIGTSSSAGEAFVSASDGIHDKPAAIGVNAPMYWSFGLERMADQILRGRVLSLGGESGTISPVNLQNGACLVQGVMVATLSRERWTAVPIIESHPTALLLNCAKAKHFLSERSFDNEHERNATLAAYAAWAYDDQTDGWHDLRSFESDACDPVPGPPPVYWFPAGSL